MEKENQTMSDKTKLLTALIVYAFAFILIIIALSVPIMDGKNVFVLLYFRINGYKLHSVLLRINHSGLLYLLATLLIALLMITFCMLHLKYKKQWMIIVSLCCLIPIPMLIDFIYGSFYDTDIYVNPIFLILLCLAIAMIWGSYFPVLIFKTIFRKQHFKINFTVKLKNLLLEIALIPLSAIDSAIGAMFYIFGGMMFTGFITRFLIWGKIKSTPIEEGYLYNVGASNKLVTTTTTHTIENSLGKEIARYNTTEQHIEHDDGVRYQVSDQQLLVGWLSPFLIIFRIISVLLSIISLFTNLYVSVRPIKTNAKYHETTFLLLDLIVFYPNKINDKHTDRISA